MKADRKIIVYIATSADGYIARPNGDVEWLNRAVQPQRVVLCHDGKSVDGGADSYRADLRRRFHSPTVSAGFSESSGSHFSPLRRERRWAAFRRAHCGRHEVLID